MSLPGNTFRIMDSTGWLIVATFAGPVLGALAATGFIAALLKVAKARAQQVKHVPVSGTDLYAKGVPLTESQFRELYAAFQAELDQLPPPAERDQWERERGQAANRKLSVLTGTSPEAFPAFGNVDQSWEWYAGSNRYTIDADYGNVRPPKSPWGLQG